MTPLVRKTLRLSLLLILVSTLSNAQNMMTRRYSIGSHGPISRGDFNEDGIPDVVYKTSTGIAVALGTAQGRLGTIKASAATLPGEGRDLVVGRFTSSGHLDVVIAYYGCCSYDEMDILLGRGDGTFEIGPRIAFGGAVMSMTASDFNRDGKTDLAVIDAGATVDIFPGNGDGTFGAMTTIGTALTCCFFPYNIRVGDFDADGRPDLAVRDASRVQVLFNDGSLRFAVKDVLIGTDAYLVDLAAKDVNQDGYTDILLSLQGEGPPNGPNPAGFSVYTSTGKTRSFTRTFYRAPGFSLDLTPDLTAADVDGDGLNDVVGASTKFKGLLVFRGQPNGSFSSTPMTFVLGDLSQITRLTSLDLNRDGRPDFVTADSEHSKIATLLNAVPRAACANSTRSPSVTVCRPADNVYLPSPVRIVGRTNDTAAPVTSVQVYVDHRLVRTVFATSIDTTVPLALGARLIVVKAWDALGRNFRTVRNVNVYSGTPGQVCSTALNTLRICAPPQNATVTSPVRVFAAANDDLKITAIQVYIDNQLVFRDLMANYVDRSFALGPGTHTIVVKTFDTSGRILSQARTITVE